MPPYKNVVGEAQTPEVEPLIKSNKWEADVTRSTGEVKILELSWSETKWYGLLRTVCFYLVVCILTYIVIYWHIQKSLEGRMIVWFDTHREIQWDLDTLIQAIKQSRTIQTALEIKMCSQHEELGVAMSCATVCREVQKQYLESQKCNNYTCSVISEMRSTSKCPIVNKTEICGSLENQPINPQECKCPKIENLIGQENSTQQCPEINEINCKPVIEALVHKSEPERPDVVVKYPQVDCPSLLKINTSRTYLTASKCWESTFNGQFFYRKGLDPPENWAPDEPISLACQGKPCGPIGEYRHTDVLRNQTRINDFRFYRWRYETSCGIRSFFVNAKDRDACLKDKTILIVGDSTIRQIFRLLTWTALGIRDKAIKTFDCDPLEASGCYDCYCGCKSEKMQIHKGDWRDMETYLKALNLTVHFSWKPNLFTMDDRILLDRYKKRELLRPDLVIIHKAAHDAFQKKVNYKVWPDTDYEKYINGRARQMVEGYNEAFSDVPVFWRAPFYDTEKNSKIMNKMRRIEEVIRPYLAEHNIRVLETSTILDQTRKAPLLFDDMHPYEFVNYVLVDAALSTICKHI